MDTSKQTAAFCAVFPDAAASGTNTGISMPVNGDITTSTATPVPAPARRERNGEITVTQTINEYMALYAGRDHTRGQRLRWWVARIGDLRLADLTEDDDRVYFALEELAQLRGRYYAGEDAEGKAIYRAKRKPLAPATINRYGAALGAVFSWAVRKRIAPLGWQNPIRRIERKVENNEVVRFLSDAEREALLRECRRSPWKKLYLFVLIGLTTGARRGEIESLRWCDLDLDDAIATIPRTTKNGDRRCLPLTPAVIEELRKHLTTPTSTALVFASRHRPDEPYGHVTSWHNALRAAGVKNFRFHDLRHSCASYLAQSGASLLEIADTLGHRSLSVTRRYSHLSTKTKANLINKVLGGIK